MIKTIMVTLDGSVEKDTYNNLGKKKRSWAERVVSTTSQVVQSLEKIIDLAFVVCWLGMINIVEYIAWSYLLQGDCLFLKLLFSQKSCLEEK